VTSVEQAGQMDRLVAMNAICAEHGGLVIDVEQRQLTEHAEKRTVRLNRNTPQQSVRDMG